MNREVLDDLIQLVLEGEATQSQVDEFENAILNDPRSMARYQTWVSLESNLEYRSQMVSATPQGVVPMDKVVEMQRKKSVKQAVFAAAALIMVSLVLLSVVMVENPVARLALEASPGAEWTVAHQSEQEGDNQNTMRRGSRVVLESGVIELVFDNGVRSVVSAPAELLYKETDVVELTHGHAWFHVPKEAVGFTVETDELRVVDLGTEFGVSAGASDYDEVHVFTGRVEVTALRNRRAKEIHSVGSGRKLTLHGEFEKIQARASEFLTVLPTAQPCIHLAFDGKGEGMLAVNSTLGTEEPVVSFVEKYSESQTFKSVNGQFGGAFESFGNGYVKTNWKGILGNKPRTLSYWIKLKPGEDHYHAVAGWGSRVLTGSNSAFYSIACSPDSGTLSGLSFGVNWVTGSVPIADGDWHHIAYTYSGDLGSDALPDIVGYVDGKEDTLHWNDVTYDEDKNPISPPVFTGSERDKAKNLWVFGPIHNDRKKNTEEVHRSIDELYVFPRVLQSEEILSLYQKNRPEQ